jgi:hypothetical protein
MSETLDQIKQIKQYLEEEADTLPDTDDIKALGDWTINVSEPTDCGHLNEDSAHWYEETHTLVLTTPDERHELASWTIASVSDWDEDGDWSCETDDTEDYPPTRVMDLCELIDLESDARDAVHGAPEPTMPETDEDGEWSLWWTHPDNGGVVSRYADVAAATIAADIKQVKFAAKNKTALCSYSVRRLVDGEWKEEETDY